MNAKNANEKKGFRLNALDIAVILVLLALVIIAAVRMGIAEKMVFSASECTVTFSCPVQVYDFPEAIKTGSVLYTDSGEELGTVKNIRVISSDGDVTGYEFDISSSLMKKDGRFISESGTEVLSGMEFTLHTQTSTVIAEVDSVS